MASIILACSVGSAQAAAFDAVAQQRRVQIGGTLHEFDYATGIQQTVSPPIRTQVGAPADWGPSSLGVGLGIQTASASAFGQGHAGLQSAFGPQQIHFSAIADVNISGYAAGPIYVDGTGQARVDASYQFIVANETPIVIAMDSSGRFGEFNFSLRRDGDASVLQDAYMIDSSGMHTHFARGLTLVAGTYSISASLLANSHLDGDNSVAGRTTADFSISAVPEPQSWAMLVAGLALLGLRRRRCQARGYDRAD